MPRRTFRFPASRSALLAAGLALGLSYAVFAAVRGITRPHRPLLLIEGRITVPLHPGASEPFNLRLTNRYGFDVALMSVTIGLTLDPSHRVAGCSPQQDFHLVQLPRREYPVLMGARSSATLSQLGVRRLPRLEMVDRDVPQDVCRGTKLRLRYQVRARRLTQRERVKLRRRGAP